LIIPVKMMKILDLLLKQKLTEARVKLNDVKFFFEIFFCIAQLNSVS
jgi:hypothetical protein